MVKIANSFWIDSYDDYKELEDCYNNGSRLAGTLEFSHEVKDGDKTYYCFRPTDRRIDGALYLVDYRIKDVFSLLNATVNYDMDGTTLTFDGRSMIINHCKTIKYKYDNEFAYKFQKTQYKSSSPYKVLSMLVDSFWNYTVARGIKIAYLDAEKEA